MKIIEKEINGLTGEETIIEREETTAEKKARESYEKQIAEMNAGIEAREAKRKEIAERLGLTSDELQVLLG